jgi:hypothetical protein
MAHTYEKIGESIVRETTTTVVEHDLQSLINRLQIDLTNMIAGRDEYLSTVNANIEALQTKINTLNNLL